MEDRKLCDDCKSDCDIPFCPKLDKGVAVLQSDDRKMAEPWTREPWGTFDECLEANRRAAGIGALPERLLPQSGEPEFIIIERPNYERARACVNAAAGQLQNFTDARLVENVLRNLLPRQPGKRARWAVVTDVFAIGSNSAHELCRRFGLDPDEQLELPECEACMERLREEEEDDAPVAPSLCWRCNHDYPIDVAACPKCGACNGNVVGIEAAMAEIQADARRAADTVSGPR